ncbi:MAG: hypothetical protein WA021_01165 [Minisyncoccia bacterium]
MRTAYVVVFSLFCGIANALQSPLATDEDKREFTTPIRGVSIGMMTCLTVPAIRRAYQLYKAGLAGAPLAERVNSEYQGAGCELYPSTAQYTEGRVVYRELVNETVEVHYWSISIPLSKATRYISEEVIVLSPAKHKRR